MTIKKAFDNCAKNYDLERKTLIPCFDEFYKTAIEIINTIPDKKIKVLDLGAGTGIFSHMASKHLSKADFTLYDISDKMLDKAEKRFKHLDINIDYKVRDYSKAGIDGKFDLIVSALSIHHLTDLEKEDLFKNAYSSLNNNGLFINADQVLGETDYIEDIYKSAWLNAVKENGVSKKSLNAAKERMKEDKMSKLSSQLNWLEKAGFSDINCWYKNYSFVVYSGLKN